MCGPIKAQTVAFTGRWRGDGAKTGETRRHGDAETRRSDENGDLAGWGRDTEGGSVGVFDPVVKDQGGRTLTGIGMDGSAENWVGFGGFRHYIDVGRNGRRLFGRLGSGLEGLGLWLGLPFLLRLLEILDGGAEGTLQLRALFGDEGEQTEVLFVEFNL